MFGFGWMELLLILIIVLIVFGAGKLPQLGEGIGNAIKGFKKTVHDAEEDAAQQRAESRTTVSEIIQKNRLSPDQQSLPPHVKDMVGGEEEQQLTRQG